MAGNHHIHGQKTTRMHRFRSRHFGENPYKSNLNLSTWSVINSCQNIKHLQKHTPQEIITQYAQNRPTSWPLNRLISQQNGNVSRGRRAQISVVTEESSSKFIRWAAEVVASWEIREIAHRPFISLSIRPF